MDYTTISYEFTASTPSLPSEMDVEDESGIKSRSATPNPALYFTASDNSASSASLVHIAFDPLNDLLCEPFIGTPEPSLSPSVFGSGSVPPMHFALNAASPVYLNDVGGAVTSSLSLLPYILPPQANTMDFACSENDIDRDHHHSSEFELVFMDNDHFIQQQPQPQSVADPSPYDYSDRTLIYEQL